MIKNYGLKLETPDPTAYTLGGIKTLPKKILVPDGNWEPYLPDPEKQSTPQYDTSGCTIFNSLNGKETLLKQKIGSDYDFSDRFNYNVAEINPPGADPHYALESIRLTGAVPEDVMPMTETLEEYKQPRPMRPDYISLARKFPWQLKHEYLWNWHQKLTKSQKMGLIREYLPYSPLGVSVTAWTRDSNGFYIDGNKPNTHWTLGFGLGTGLFVFDSYPPFIKQLHPAHNIQVCKRFWLAEREKRSWWCMLKSLWQ